MKETLQQLNQDTRLKPICDVLAKMDCNIKKKEHIQELVQKMREYGDMLAYIKVFPALCKLALQNLDIGFLEFVTNVKYITDITDLNLVSDDEIKLYLDALFEITGDFSSQTTIEDIKEMGLSEVDGFSMANCAHVLGTFTKDTLAFYQYRIFDKAFHVKCQHCQNDIHSLVLGEDDIIPLQGIKGSPANSRIIWRLNAMKNMKFEREEAIVWHLYGKYKCTVCGGENIPIQAAGKHIVENIGERKLSEALLLRLKKILVDETIYDIPSWHDKVVFKGEFVAALYRDFYGTDDIRYFEFMLKNAVVVHTFYGEKYVRYLANSAIEAVENTSADELVKASVYFSLGHALGFHYSISDDQRREAMQYYELAENIYLKEFGKDDTKYIDTKRRKHCLFAQLPEGDFAPILEDIEIIRKHPDFSDQHVLNLERLVASYRKEDQANIEEEIELQLKSIEEIAKEYGAESDIVADYRQELAGLYLQAGDYDLAKQNFEKAIEIHTRELGKEYMLPDFLRELVHTGKKIVKIERPSSELAVRARSVADAYGDIADFYYEIKDYKSALNAHKKGLDLWLWLSFDKSVEVAHKYAALGKTYIALSDIENAKISAEKSLEIYEFCINYSTFESEVYEAQEEISTAKELLEEIANI